MDKLTHELNYRFTIIEAINFLKQTRKEAFVKLVNIAMAGEWSDSDSVFKDGDEITIDHAYFRNSEDDNIHGLLRLLKITDETIDYLIDRNNIKDHELDVIVK